MKVWDASGWGEVWLRNCPEGFTTKPSTLLTAAAALAGRHLSAAWVSGDSSPSAGTVS